MINMHEENEKTITYNIREYTVKDTVKLAEGNMFQSVQFPNGYYGILYYLPESNKYDVILVGTSDTYSYVDVFMDMVRRHELFLKEFPNNIDDVELAVYVDEKNKEVYREVINKEDGLRLIEKLEIAMEINEIRRESETDNLRQMQYLLLFLCLLNILCVCYNIGRIMGML